MTFWSLTNTPILADGAIGTLLVADGVEGCLETQSLVAPETVATIHRAYWRAGAQVALTHTFGANRLALQRHGLGDQTKTINLAAAKVLRDSMTKDLSHGPFWMVGNIGPSQWPSSAMAPDSAGILHEAFREHAQALQLAGVDALLLETFTNLFELRQALQAVASLGMPLLVSVSPRPDGSLWDGTPFADWVSVCEFYEPRMVGLNCVPVHADTLKIVQNLKALTQRPLWFKPHAGLPEARLSPAQFAQTLRPFLPHIAILGGCCGTSPAHVAALHDVLHLRIE